MENKVLSKPALLEAKIDHLVVSQCGNFAFLGLNNGSISKVNIQSGKERAKSQAMNNHTGSITGIKCDALN
jgi:hypothetical protein